MAVEIVSQAGAPRPLITRCGRVRGQRGGTEDAGHAPVNPCGVAEAAPAQEGVRWRQGHRLPLASNGELARERVELSVGRVARDRRALERGSDGGGVPAGGAEGAVGGVGRVLHLWHNRAWRSRFFPVAAARS